MNTHGATKEEKEKAKAYFEEKKVSHNEVAKYLEKLREPSNVANIYAGK